MSILVKQRLLLAIGLLALVATLLAPRIPQDPAYHLFADRSSWLAIPNTLNILTNLLFAWVGIEGLYRLLLQKSMQIEPQLNPCAITFFGALIGVSIGSSYYHWSPDNLSLVGDRLAINIGFISFITILLIERASLRIMGKIFTLLLIAGIASVGYWYFSELSGRGDLRFYALFQILPMLLTPLILIIFKPRYSRSSDIWWLWIWYLVAKFCEFYDHEIYRWLEHLSGHSLKHIAAGIGALIFLRHLRFRELLRG